MNNLQYTEYGPEGNRLKQFSGVTYLTSTEDNAKHLVRGGVRPRWKVENETFNTLKNQGYRFAFSPHSVFNLNHPKPTSAIPGIAAAMVTPTAGRTYRLGGRDAQAVRRLGPAQMRAASVEAGNLSYLQLAEVTVCLAAVS